MPAVPRVVLITGAAGGIGSAMVQLFHQQEWEVIGVDRVEMDGLLQMKIHADLSQIDDAQRIVAQV